MLRKVILLVSFIILTPAYGSFCTKAMGLFGIRVTDGPVQERDQVSVHLGGKTYSLTGLRALLTLGLLSGGGVFAWNNTFPDHPALTSVNIQQADGSTFNANTEERRMLAALQSAGLHDGPISGLESTVNEFEGDFEAPNQFHFPGTEISARHNADGSYDVGGVTGVNRVLVEKAGTHGLAFHFEGGPNYARPGSQLRVSFYWKRGVFTHRLSTGWNAIRASN